MRVLERMTTMEHQFSSMTLVTQEEEMVEREMELQLVKMGDSERMEMEEEERMKMEKQFAKMGQEFASERKKMEQFFKNMGLNLSSEWKKMEQQFTCMTLVTHEERKKTVRKIFTLTAPLLIGEDHNTRVEGRKIISDLSKTAGLDAMIDALRPEIETTDEYFRNITAQSFSAAASALGIPALLPFLKEVCQSNKCWQARHTGIMIVQHITILMGSAAVLPYLTSLVAIIKPGLFDDTLSVRTITLDALAALGQAAGAYGIFMEI